MNRSSENHLGASSSSPPFRQLGEFSEEEACDTIAKKKKKVTIEQEQQKGMAERTPLEIQNKQEGKKKEESVTIQGRKEEEYVKIQVEPDVQKMQGVEAQNSFSNYGHSNESESGHGVMSYAVLEVDTPLQFQHKNLESKKEEHVTIQGRKEEEYVTIQVEPDAPQLQMKGVEAQSSFNHSGPMADSESGIMSYAVLIILVVAEVVLGLDFFGVL